MVTLIKSVCNDFFHPQLHVFSDKNFLPLGVGKMVFSWEFYLLLSGIKWEAKMVFFSYLSSLAQNNPMLYGIFQGGIFFCPLLLLSVCGFLSFLVVLSILIYTLTSNFITSLAENWICKFFSLSNFCFSMMSRKKKRVIPFLCYVFIQEASLFNFIIHLLP